MMFTKHPYENYLATLSTSARFSSQERELYVTLKFSLLAGIT